MGVYEIIEQLCTVARLQADIIQKQAEIIAQCEIADAVASELAEICNKASSSLDNVEKFYKQGG